MSLWKDLGSIIGNAADGKPALSMKQEIVIDQKSVIKAGVVLVIVAIVIIAVVRLTKK